MPFNNIFTGNIWTHLRILDFIVLSIFAFHFNFCFVVLPFFILRWFFIFLLFPFFFFLPSISLFLFSFFPLYIPNFLPFHTFSITFFPPSRLLSPLSFSLSRLYIFPLSFFFLSPILYFPFFLPFIFSLSFFPILFLLC